MHAASVDVYLWTCAWGRSTWALPTPREQAQSRCWEPAPLKMPLRAEPFVFTDLEPATYGLPAIPRGE